LLHRLRRHHRYWRCPQYREVEPGAKAVVFGLGGIGLNVIQGLRLAGADMIIGVDINNAKKEWGERFGMTHFVNPKEVGSDLVAYLVNMTKRGADQIGGADYTFDYTGNVTVMRQALEACHRGWGQSIIIGVAPSGAEIATRPFQLVTGRVWKGTAFGGARGRTDVPKIVDWYMAGKIRVDPMMLTACHAGDQQGSTSCMKARASGRGVLKNWADERGDIRSAPGLTPRITP
jgi:S-(hydroxymethyl)glutathione dehydrogenase/alcohol dehydrogenase